MVIRVSLSSPLCVREGGNEGEGVRGGKVTGERKKKRDRESCSFQAMASMKGIQFYKEFFHGLKIYNEIEKYTLKSDANDVKKHGK